MPTNQEKEQVWKSYRERKTIRVPVMFGVNPRVILLDPDWNPKGITVEEYYRNADAAVEIQFGFLRHQTEYISQFCDSPVGRPKEWSFYADCQNIYDSAYFGGPINFRENQVPDVEPYLAGDGKNRIFDIDIDRPLENPFVKECLARYEDLKAAVAKLPDEGIQYKVTPPLLGFDGPLTVATNLRSSELFTDFYEDPEYAQRLMEFIQRGAILRNQAMYGLFGQKYVPTWFADDSVQLISTEMYVQRVLPLHREFYRLFPEGAIRNIHLCGDVLRHMPTLAKELNIRNWDTGFPVDHGLARRVLGEEMEIQGGPEVALLLSGTPEQVFARTRDILQSGVMRGGRFVLREANNLPPCCPQENLSAMYRAAMEFGRYANG